MFVLGLILILLSAGTLVAVLSTGTNDQAAMYGGSIELPTLVIFLAGAAALLLFIMGLELVRSGVKRANQNRLNKKRLRKLEKREDARQDGVVGGTAPAATGDGTSTTGEGTPTTGDRPATGPANGTATGSPEGTSTTDGPYQTPPPAR